MCTVFEEIAIEGEAKGIAEVLEDFYNPVNQQRLHKSIERLEKGLGTAHELIDEKNRLVYKIADETIRIAQCRTHYGDK